MRKSDALISTVSDSPERSALDFLNAIRSYDSWMEEALCAQVDPDMWFPPVGERGTEAKKICMRCPVREQCLDYALNASENPYGIWGGVGQHNRNAMRRERGEGDAA